MACDRNGVVGKNGAIPWRYQDEFKHFQDTIGNHPIIIGRKSFELIPESILKDRISIVFSRNKNNRLPRRVAPRNDKSGNIILVSSVEDFFSLNIMNKEKKIFMIGGAQLANYFLKYNLISEFILTIIKTMHDGDTFLDIKSLNSWQNKLVNATTNYNIYRLIAKKK